MKMNQIVYVVMNSESATIYGVYNDENDAIAVATGTWVNAPEVTITPVLVDARPTTDNENCESAEELRDSVNDIFEWMQDEGEEVYDLEVEDEDEDEDEEYEYSDEEEDEDEDESEGEITYESLHAAVDLVISALKDMLEDYED